MATKGSEHDMYSSTTPLSSSQLQLDSSAVQELEMMIYLRDRTTLRILLEDGHAGKTSDFIDIVFQAQKLPEEAREIFCLWFTSPLLELRLKPGHQPYEVALQWEDLLDIYTDASQENLVLDEPMLYFQRDVFYSVQQENKVTDVNSLLYLYHEAKYNVIVDRYILRMEHYHKLAGIQALIHLQHYDPRTHVEALYRSHIEQFYPSHLCVKRGWFDRKKSAIRDGLWDQLQQHHRAISEHHKNESMDALLPKLYRQYLAICWNYPFYGAAYFTAMIQQPSESTALHFLRGDVMTDVYVTVNTDGVCIIDRQKNDVLLTLAYTQLSWDVSISDDDSLPILMLQFTHGENTKLLKVYSWQVKLINALIESCVNLKKREMQQLGQDIGEYINKAGGDAPDGAGDIRCSFDQINTQLDKLSLCTYSPNGEMLD